MEVSIDFCKIFLNYFLKKNSNSHLVSKTLVICTHDPFPNVSISIIITFSDLGNRIFFVIVLDFLIKERQ